MAELATLTEMDILADAIVPEAGDLTPAVAESVLHWKFTDRAVTKMNELARRNSEGNLTPAEQQELDNFIRVGSLINLFQAKARVSLKLRNSA